MSEVKRGRGRPKGAKNIGPMFGPELPPGFVPRDYGTNKKKRGRPKGSKNIVDVTNYATLIDQGSGQPVNKTKRGRKAGTDNTYVTGTVARRVNSLVESATAKLMDAGDLLSGSVKPIKKAAKKKAKKKEKAIRL